MAISTTPVTSISGTATGTNVTVTLPAYSLSNFMVMFVSSNNGNAQTISSPVTATVLGNASNRLIAYKLVPINGSQTTFTITVSTSSVFTWWIATYSGVDLAATAFGAGNNIGNSTTAPIEIPSTTGDFVATGNELALWAGSVNATATWTTGAPVIFNTTTGNAALAVGAGNMTAGALSITPAALDRGLGGTSRNESAVSVILQPTPAGTTNLLANPSFEDAAGTSVGWEAESTTIGSPAFTKLSTGAIDGTRRQQMQYAGQSGDSGKFFAIYQSPITASPGDVFTFSIFLSGSKANCDLVIGIEGFSTGMVYISEDDTYITSLTGTMTEYTVSYTAQSGTIAVAVYIQANALTPTTAITVQMDKAILTSVASSVSGQIKVHNGSTFVAKPVKVWNGTAFVTKPLKVWNGSAWVTTPY